MPRFRLDAFQHIVDAPHMVDIELSLLVLVVRGVDVGDRAVAVPFKICYLGVLGEYVVDHVEYIVLHLGVAHVEHKLVAVIICVAVGLLYDPVGMLLIKLAFWIDHLGFNPYAEFYIGVIGRFYKGRYSAGEFVVCHFPVAKTGMIVLARILVAKPSVVEKEHVYAKMFCLFHQLRKNILVEIESGVFPIVQEGETRTVAVFQ